MKVNYWTDDLQLTEHSKEIVDAVMKERQIAIAGVTFLISRFAGENVVVPASPEAVEVWRQEVITEALSRISEAEIEEFKRGVEP